MEVASLWIGERLGPCEELCLVSFLEMGHRVTIYAYRTLDVPTGVLLRDARSIVPSPKFVRYKNNESVASFADHFRCLLQRHNDVLWVDTDIFALRPLTFNAPYVFGRVPRRDGRFMVNNAVLKIPSGSDLLDRLLPLYQYPSRALAYLNLGRRRAALQRYRQTGRWDGALPWGSFGYLALSTEIQRLGLQDYVRPEGDFYRLEGAKLFNANHDFRGSVEQGAYAAHFTSSWFAKKKIDLLRPHPGSFYAWCVAHYGRRTSYF